MPLPTDVFITQAGSWSPYFNLTQQGFNDLSQGSVSFKLDCGIQPGKSYIAISAPVWYEDNFDWIMNLQFFQGTTPIGSKIPVTPPEDNYLRAINGTGKVPPGGFQFVPADVEANIGSIGYIFNTTSRPLFRFWSYNADVVPPSTPPIVTYVYGMEINVDATLAQLTGTINTSGSGGEPIIGVAGIACAAF